MPTLVDCPQSNRGEWRFHLFGVPVRVKFWFWIALLILGGDQEPGAALIWIAVCFGSILLHELGHVCAFRAFGQEAEVVLYAFGGMAVPHRGVRTTRARVLVALAGPGAGFCVTALTLAAAHYSGAAIQFGWHMFIPALAVLPAMTGGMPSHLSSYHWYVLANDLLFVNFYWGLVNLLPIYPLDGGHASMALFEQHDPYRGRRNSLILSALVAGAVTLLGVVAHSLYLALLFLILAVSSIQAFESEGQRGTPGRTLR